MQLDKAWRHVFASTEVEDQPCRAAVFCTRYSDSTVNCGRAARTELQLRGVTTANTSCVVTSVPTRRRICDRKDYVKLENILDIDCDVDLAHNSVDDVCEQKALLLQRNRATRYVI